eukprot:jgi/Bigna1/136087/aug1.32_g10795
MDRRFASPSRPSSPYSKLESTSYLAQGEGPVSYFQAKIERTVKDLKEKGTSNFSDRYLKDEGCIAVCSAAALVPSLTVLNLGGNDIRSSGGNAIASLLEATSTLRTLRLSWNYLGVGDGMTSIARGISRNRSLRALDLRNNRIGPGGAEALASMLKANRTLTSLDLRWNQIMDVGARALLEGLARNDTLIAMPLSGNKRNAEQSRAIKNPTEAQRLVADELELASPLIDQAVSITDEKNHKYGKKSSFPHRSDEGELIDRMARSHVK